MVESIGHGARQSGFKFQFCLGKLLDFSEFLVYLLCVKQGCMLNEIAVRIQVRVYIKPLVGPVSGTL